MNSVLSNIKIQVNENTFVKDPETSILGKKIIQESILLMNEIGFENFTFKKLGERIGSNESSIYRYFESKHKLLVYLSSWYWGWIEYRFVFETNNIANPLEKLRKGITIVTEKIEDDTTTEHINEALLNRIIITEFTKTIYNKEIEEENKQGFFLIYKRVITRLEEMILNFNPKYLFAKSLASSIVQGALHQHFLKEHLQTITNCDENNTPTDFYLDLVQKTVSN